MTFGKSILCQNATFEKVKFLAFPCFSFIFRYFPLFSLCFPHVVISYIYYTNRVYIQRICVAQLTTCDHGCWTLVITIIPVYPTIMYIYTCTSIPVCNIYNFPLFSCIANVFPLIPCISLDFPLLVPACVCRHESI